MEEANEKQSAESYDVVHWNLERKKRWRWVFIGKWEGCFLELDGFLVRNRVNVLMAENWIQLAWRRSNSLLNLCCFCCLQCCLCNLFIIQAFFAYTTTTITATTLQYPLSFFLSLSIISPLPIILFLNCTVHANFVILSCFGLCFRFVLNGCPILPGLQGSNCTFQVGNTADNVVG